ncbi:hypothetical protein [Streptomyces sp. NPDC017940]|uniref:hypothetical protein n=1 Tax=Streptomyces sp. NPDC017940 TaxID=3365017 RepID=UPI0037A98275
MDALRLRAAVAKLPDDISVSMAAHHLLGRAVQAEAMMDSVIAARLGRSIAEVLVLHGKVISQMSINAKLSLLQEIMEGEGWGDDFPFVVPVLRALFALRNKLAHSLPFGFAETPLAQPAARFWSARRGNVKIEEITVSTIVGMVHSAQHVIGVDMNFLHVRALPDSYWTEM